MDVELLLKPLNFCLWILKIFGLHQDGNQSWTYLILGHLGFILTIDIFFFGELCFIFTAQTLNEISEALSTLLASGCFVIKTINYLKFAKSWTRIKGQIEELITESYDERFEDQKFTEKYLTQASVMLKIFLASCFTMAIGGLLMISLTRKLPYPVLYPFDVDNNIFGFITAALHQSATGIYGAFLLSSFDILPVMLLAYPIGFLEKLSLRLDAIGSSEKFEYEELVKCIKIHTLIKNFVDEIKNHFGLMLFCQSLVSRVTICMCIYTSLEAEGIYERVRTTAFVIPMVLEVFLPCFYGQKLMIASENVSAAILDSKWFNTGMKTRKTIYYFMGTLNRTMKISILHVFDVNLIAFGRIINFTYTLLALLKELGD